MSIVLSFVTFLFLHSPVYVEGIGFLALFTEAMLGVPQLLKNLHNKSTEGMRLAISKITHPPSLCVLLLILNFFSFQLQHLDGVNVDRR